MRTIKFRGKCVPDSKYAGQWVVGGYVHPDEECKNQNEGLIVSYLGGNSTFTCHVIPETVGQFTGLYDKNDKEIYEGDILYVTVFDCFGGDTQYKVQVLWVGTEFVGEYSEIGEEKSWDLQWLCDLDDEIEVIGNIHDNPELLEEK